MNTERNQWYDFYALGKGGNIIALASHLYTVPTACHILLKRIEEQTPHSSLFFLFWQAVISEPSFQQLEIVPLSPALLTYLQERGINIALAKKKGEARFTHNGKRYFAIAFPNMSGGYEIRNRYFKAVSHPEISHIRQSGKAKGNSCYVFEGFMDYLSFLTLRQEAAAKYPELDRQDYMVLNSVANVSKSSLSVGQLRTHPLFFDNDHAGMEALSKSAWNTAETQHPGRFTNLQRMQGPERILAETDMIRKGKCNPVRKEDDANQETERLPVIAHYNYTPLS